MTVKRIGLSFFYLIILLRSTSVSAQYNDSSQSPVPLTDSTRQPVPNCTLAPTKRSFFHTAYLLPSALIIYSVLTLHTDLFQDVNETIKMKIYADGAHHKTTLDNYLQYSPAVAVYALNIGGIHGANNFRDRTIIYAISNIIQAVTVTATKKITRETRPDGSDNLSFPSGHTATAFAAAEFLHQEYKNISPLYGVAGYIAAAATGYLRMYNNKHWLGDVVAGAGVGIISTKLAYCIYPVIKRKLFKDKNLKTVIIPSYQSGAFGVAFTRFF